MVHNSVQLDVRGSNRAICPIGTANARKSSARSTASTTPLPSRSAREGMAKGMAEAWRRHGDRMTRIERNSVQNRGLPLGHSTRTIADGAFVGTPKCSTGSLLDLRPSRSSSSHRPHFRRIVAIQAQWTAVDQHQQIEIAISVEIEVAPSSAVGRRTR